MEYKRITYSSKQGKYEDGTDCIEVWLDARPNCIYTGANEKEAVEWMLLGVAQLAFERNLMPGAPELNGNPDPIQCAISLLSTALSYAVKERDWAVLPRYSTADGDESESTKEKECNYRASERARLSELIGNLGTALAALARVKHD
jgi:hypothetical protein